MSASIQRGTIFGSLERRDFETGDKSQSMWATGHDDCLSLKSGLFMTSFDIQAYIGAPPFFVADRKRAELT